MWSIISAFLWSSLMGVQGFASNLWYEFTGGSNHLNGLLDALGRGFGILGSLATPHFPRFISSYLHLVISSLLLILALSVFLQAVVPIEWVSYAAYVFFVGLSNLLLSIVTPRIASCSKNAKFAFIFGVNMGMALALQALINAVSSALKFSIYAKFYAYGGQLLLCLIIYILLYFLCVRSINPPIAAVVLTET